MDRTTALTVLAVNLLAAAVLYPRIASHLPSITDAVPPGVHEVLSQARLVAAFVYGSPCGHLKRDRYALYSKRVVLRDKVLEGSGKSARLPVGRCCAGAASAVWEGRLGWGVPSDAHTRARALLPLWPPTPVSAAPAPGSAGRGRPNRRRRGRKGERRGAAGLWASCRHAR